MVALCLGLARVISPSSYLQYFLRNAKLYAAKRSPWRAISEDAYRVTRPMRFERTPSPLFVDSHEMAVSYLLAHAKPPGLATRQSANSNANNLSLSLSGVIFTLQQSRAS